MKELMIKPEIYHFDTVRAFAEEFQIGEGDMVVTNEYIYKPFFGELNLKCDVIFQEKYGQGEPSDDMVEAMYKDIHGEHKRVIAVGGGTVIDISKLFALKEVSSVLDLYDGKIPPVKDKELVLVPEPLESLPFGVFATSSIDALVHAVESSLSPKGNQTTRMFGYKAIEMILAGYQEIAKNGPEARKPLLSQFLMASNYAGIAFGNAGCAAVHAMSYPLGATYHVPHGESNYAMFTGVMKNYMEIKKDGEIAKLNRFIADILGCSTDDVYEELEKLLNHLIQKKPLHEYGMREEEIEEFTDSVIENQQRLLANNFVPLDRERMIKIYRELY